MNFFPCFDRSGLAGHAGIGRRPTFIVASPESLPDQAAPPATDDRAHERHLFEAIAIARVLCMCGIVYVHAWIGVSAAQLAALDMTPQGLLRWGLVELFGRSAVPLLGIISGWLAVRSARRRHWPDFIKRKARTIFLPMVVWNILAIILVSGAGYLGLIDAPRPTGLWWLVDEIFCLATPDQINVQMSFLRDLFVCMLLAPILVRMASALLAAIAAAAFAWAIAGIDFPLLLRPQILAFFTLGILIKRGGTTHWLATRPIALVALPYALLAAAKIWLETIDTQYAANVPLLLATLDIALRVAAAFFFWCLAWRLASRPLGDAVRRLEPYVFLMFCSHLIMIWFAGPTVGRVTGPLGSPLFPIILLLQPVFVMAAAIALGRVLMLVAPGAARLLSGGRLTDSVVARRTSTEHP
jgi:fucose 4-O-acetylase-like acetyltransferase